VSADFRLMALEHTTDDLFDVAAYSARYRECYLLALAMLADRESRLQLAREHYARLRDENRRLRAQIIRADDSEAA
jgi:hypothetical protein